MSGATEKKKKERVESAHGTGGQRVPTDPSGTGTGTGMGMGTGTGNRHFFTTRDLVIIAILAALGGALSTYIGYLGNLINRMLGVPFGAGQFMAGLHIIWILLAIGLTRKRGAGTITGVVKGLVEFFMGSTHGVVVVIVCAIQGAVADGVLFSDRVKAERKVVPYAIAGGLSAMTNVLVFQTFYFAGVPWLLIAVLCMLAAGSGIIFGGWLPLQIMRSLDLAGITHWHWHRHHGGEAGGAGRAMPRGGWPALVSGDEGRKSKGIVYTSVIVTIAFFAAFTMGAVYYFSEVYVPPLKEGVEVTGAVDEPYTFVYADHRDEEVTVRAELIGSVTHLPPQNYTGIPVGDILRRAHPKPRATKLVVVAKDGYRANFDLFVALNDTELLLSQEEGGSYRLVAANYDGAYWIKECYKLEVQ